MLIKTASWFTPLPPDHVRVAISRGVPRKPPKGFRRFDALAPGPWFKTVGPEEYLARYTAILDAMNPRHIAETAIALARGQVPVLVCFEDPKKIEAGKTWCHRHILAQWFEDRLGISVEELGHPGLARFRFLEEQGLAAPSWRVDA